MSARRLRGLGWALLVAAALAVAAVLGLASNGSPAIGRQAPQLPRERLVGPPTTLGGLLAGSGGRPVVVVFWASWCDPCATEAAAIEHFSRSALGHGRIVGVNWSDAIGGARAFIKVHRWTFPDVRDSEGLVGNSYRLTGLPTTFVLDSHGRIRSALRGPQTEQTLHAALAAVERN
jgi:thiol-disulfide isomerase/thioredoxin